MQNNNSNQTIETRIQYLKSISPEERRVFAVKMQEEQTNYNKRAVIIATVFGLFMLIASFYSWKFVYHMSNESTLGAITGLVLFFIGFQIIKSSVVFTPFKKLYPNYFTDEDIFTYFQELLHFEQKTSTLVKAGRVYFFVVSMAMLFLCFFRSQWDFPTSAFISGMSMLMICHGIYIYQNTKIDESA